MVTASNSNAIYYIASPGPGEQWWRIPSGLSAAQLKARATVLRRAGAGERGDEVTNSFLCLHLISTLSQVVRDIDNELLGVQRGMGAVMEQRRKKKKKKRGPNKWMPFR